MEPVHWNWERRDDATALRRKLAEVRRLGHAYSPGSIEAVSTGIAVPVRDGSGVIAALGVVVPRGRERRDDTVAALQQAAAGISAAARISPFHSMG